MRAYRWGLAEEAKESGITDPPEVKIVRFIDTREFATVIAQCVNERGIPATVASDGMGYGIGDIPKSQYEASNLVQYECDAMYPIHPQYRLPASTKVQRAVYQYMVTVQIPCLRGLGYTFQDIPSEEVWVAHYNDPWDPEMQILKSEGWSAVEKARVACPLVDQTKIVEHPPVLK